MKSWNWTNLHADTHVAHHHCCKCGRWKNCVRNILAIHQILPKSFDIEFKGYVTVTILIPSLKRLNTNKSASCPANFYLGDKTKLTVNTVYYKQIFQMILSQNRHHEHFKTTKRYVVFCSLKCLEHQIINITLHFTSCHIMLG